MSFIKNFFTGKPQSPEPPKQIDDIKPVGEGKEGIDEQRSKTLWQLLSNAIGMDLSAGFTIPVYYCEHSTNLTKMIEILEYEYLLEQALTKKTPIERLATMAIFVISGYSNCLRTQKPLNPLLGETFEYVDKERNVRCFAEQISHHPPISASHVEHSDFTLWQQAHIRSKFLGNSCDLYPEAKTTVYLHESGELYTWVPAVTKVHNLIIGSLWLEVIGELIVENLTNGDKCVLNFEPAGWFGRYTYNVTGVCTSADGVDRIAIKGKWNESAEAVWISDSVRAEYEQYINKTDLQRNELPIDMLPRNVRELELARKKAPKQAKMVPGKESLVASWKVPPNNYPNIYGMTDFAHHMPELVKDDEYYYTSDSRLRPDLRTIAAKLKERAIFFKGFLEDEQRKDRKMFAEKAGPDFKWKPVWFRLVGDDKHVYDGGYWEHVAVLRGEKNPSEVEKDLPDALGLNVKQVEGLAMDFHRYNFTDNPENLTPEQRKRYAKKESKNEE